MDEGEAMNIRSDHLALILPIARRYGKRLPASDLEELEAELRARLCLAYVYWQEREDGEYPTGAFVSRWLQNSCLVWLKRRQRNRLREVEVAADFERQDPAPGPEEQLMHAVRLAEVRRVFDQLPARWREAFWLTRIEGVGRDEAARRLGVGRGTPACWVTRAVEAMRRRL